MNRYLYLFLFCCFVPLYIAAQDNDNAQSEEPRLRLYTPASVPSPKVYGQEYYVSDPDGILRPTLIDSLNRVCHSLYRTVEVEMAVVLIGGFDEDKWRAVDFCQELFNGWGIGGAERNTGVLLFFSLGTRDIRIHTGYGMEGLLPDAVCDMIIDDNIESLSAGDYNAGIWGIAYDIADQLLTKEAKEELLLGWTPKRHKEEDDWMYFYLLLSLILLIVMTLVVLRKWDKISKASFDKRPDLIIGSKNLQNGLGCLSLLFPLTLPFLFMKYRKQRLSLSDLPYTCPSCGNEMKRMPADTVEQIGSETDKIENRLHIFRFDFWKCPSCGEVHTARFRDKTYDRYQDCKNCGEHALAYIESNVKKQPTYHERGEGNKTYACAVCGHKTFVPYSIPSLYEREQQRIREQLRETARRSSYSSGSSRSSGSWGGGRSGGGGAGRKF